MTAFAAGRWAIRASPTSTSAARRSIRAFPIASSIAAGPTRHSCRAALAGFNDIAPSLAGVARSKGVTAPIVASNSGFSPQLLKTPAAPALLDSIAALVGGGDVAIAFVDDEVTSAFMRYLASPESAEVWIPNGGLTSPNNNADTGLYPDDVSRQIAESLVGAESFRFDMSDLVPSAFGGTTGQGFWQEMITFYENPDDIDGAMQRLEDAAAAAYDG